MKLKLTLSFDVMVTLPGVNINEIFVGIDEELKELGPEIASKVLEEIQEEAVKRIEAEEWTLEELRHKDKNGDICPGGHWERSGYRGRTMKGALGYRAEFAIQQMRCGICGRYVRVLLPILGVNKWQRHTDELERQVCEETCKQSYRWGSETLEQIGGIPVPKSSAHRWVVEGEFEELLNTPIKEKTFEGMMIDGTGLKRQGKDWDKKDKGQKKKEIRVVIGITKEGKVTPIGTWTDKKWEEIAGEVRERAGKEWGVDYVLTDGEKGLLDSFAGFGKYGGRCEWHLPRNLGYTLWQEGVTKEERGPYVKKLIDLIGIELPEEDYTAIDEETKAEVVEKLKKNEQAYEELIETFEKKGLKKPAEYLRGALGRIFTNVKIWLALGYISPKAISVLERIMRLLKRRMKSIGARWSSEGAGKIAGLLLKKIYQRKEWNRFWIKKLDLRGRFQMRLTSVEVVPV